MTSKRFVFLAFALTALMALLMVGFNMSMDEFALHGDATGKERRIWTYNRASKFLLSLNYIPTNFDGILIGSSSSATMLDTRKIKGSKIYNLSMNGANVCEVAPAAINALERGQMKYLIVCLDPYFTKDSMMKTSELSPTLETSALGSLFTVRFYLYKIKNTLFPQSDPYRESWWGHRIIIDDKPPVDTQSRGKKVDYPIDPKAFECLEEVIKVARHKGVSIFGYFHPKPINTYTANKENYAAFRSRMESLFLVEDHIWDFNTPEFAGLTENSASFSDQAHLSKSGAEMVLKEMEKRILEQ